MLWTITVIGMPRLSTPVAYISAAFVPDTFAQPAGPSAFIGYLNMQATEEFPDTAAIGIAGVTAEQLGVWRANGYVLVSVGPDRVDPGLNPGGDPAQGAALAWQYFVNRSAGIGLNYVYDPTNGTISVGDVARSAKGELR